MRSDLATVEALTGTSLYRDVVRYAAMGDHRTATPADLETSHWLNRELGAAGFQSEYVDWPLRQFMLDASYVELYGHRIDAFPLWYPTGTGADGLQASLVPIDDKNVADARGKIALVNFTDEMVTPTSGHAAVINQLVDAGGLAATGCFLHPSGKFYGHNVIPPYNQQPWPIPVVTLGAGDWHVLEHAASLGDTAALLARS